MKINELFEESPNRQIPGVVPGDKITPTPPGARPSGDFPTPITQGPPKTSNTPQTNSPTGFTPASTTSPTTEPTTPGTTPETPMATAADLKQAQTPDQSADTEAQKDMAQDLQSLKLILRQMQGQLTPPPPPPN